MQNKGIVKFIALVLILVCCFYLSFSFVTRYHENKAAAMVGSRSGVPRLHHERESVLRNLFFQAVPRDGNRPRS